MYRFWLIVTLLLMTLHVNASQTESIDDAKEASGELVAYHTIYYKDWRLDRPFLHGLSVSLSLGLLESQRSNWQEAGPLEPSGVPSGMVEYIVKHSKVAFIMGITVGVIFYLYIALSIFYRIRNKELHARFHFLRLLDQDDVYRKSLN
ncbi:hypothetical protein [Thalassotalea piscium]|uniref:Uncharacterized protein n=1 Tax=Thalassotalea piscium TaxID=1230533 RepID=A0A7X0NKK7_9GAMM|nr:hypothetical protein [Thalassotalea piscium]MBB6545138.1 hypothetical protein [Thalassotalea piscium]